MGAFVYEWIRRSQAKAECGTREHGIVGMVTRVGWPRGEEASDRPALHRFQGKVLTGITSRQDDGSSWRQSKPFATWDEAKAWVEATHSEHLAALVERQLGRGKLASAHYLDGGQLVTSYDGEGD